MIKGAMLRRPALLPLSVMLLFIAALSYGQADGLQTIAARLELMPELRTFNGRIEAVNQATVAAETRGRIESIFVDVGDWVPAGTLILNMTSTEQRAALSQAEASLAEARSNLAAESAEFARVEELFATEFVSRAELDRARARLESARSRVENARAALDSAREQVSYTEVRAPYSGLVSARHVEPGEAVQPGTPLLSGYDPGHLRVQVDLPQQVADRVREYRRAVLVPANAEAGEAVAPEKLILYPTADPATSTIRARLELPEGIEDYYPGQFVRVHFTVGEAERLLIPHRSVVYRSEVVGVYVVKDGRPQLRQIRPGARFGEQLEVLAGLAAGEMVALDPVEAAMRLTAQRQR